MLKPFLTTHIARYVTIGMEVLGVWMLASSSNCLPSQETEMTNATDKSMLHHAAYWTRSGILQVTSATKAKCSTECLLSSRSPRSSRMSKTFTPDLRKRSISTITLSLKLSHSILTIVRIAAFAESKHHIAVNSHGLAGFLQIAPQHNGG